MFRNVKLASGAALLVTLGTPLAVAADSFPRERSVCAAPHGDVVISLRQAVDLSLCHQPSLRSAQAALARAEAGVSQASSALGIQATLSTSYQNTNTPASDRSAVSLTASKVLFDFGSRGYQVLGAQAQADAVHAEVDLTSLQVMAEASRRYFEASTAQADLDGERMRLSAASQALARASARLEQGVGIRLEVLQASAQLEQARLGLAKAAGRLALAEVSLGQYLGMAASGLAARLEPVEPHAALASVAPLEEMLTAAKTNSPALRAAKSRLEAAWLEMNATSNADKATLRVTAGADITRPSGHSTSRDARVGLVLDIPLLDGGSSKARVRAAAADLRQAEANVDLEQQLLESAVASARQNLLTAQQSLAAAQAFTAAAADAHRQALGQYEAGVAELHQVLSAQTAAADARSSLNTARLAWHTSQVELSLALGTPWVR